jgi:SAM-dependent methyltransferase
VSDFYDRPGVLERYREATAGVSDPKDVMEEPALLEEIGDPRGLRVVDLGCGDAAIGRTLLEAGCARYLGVDGSARMVEAARETLRGSPGEAVRGDIAAFTAAPGTFDLVISRLALHYVADLDGVLAAARACLSPSGRIVLSTVHPVMTSHDPREDPDALMTDWVVDDYFDGGPRERCWLGETVVWHHRTVEDHLGALRRADFELTALRECPPRRERFGGDEAEYARRRRIPRFLLLAGRAR